MGLFSFGGSRSTSNSSSSSFDQSTAGSVSGGAGSASSQDTIAFEDVFARLFGGAEGAAAGLDPSMLTTAANTLFSSGTGFLSGIGGDAGTEYLTNRVGGNNDVLQEQIDALGSDLGNFFSNQINPEITSAAVGGGQLGGGRQGVAQGQAATAVGEQFRRGVTELRAGDMAARDAAAGTLAQNSIEGALTAFQGIPGLLGTADIGFGAQLAPFERLAAILGGPTTLNASNSSSSDFSQSFSNSFGVSRANSSSSGRSLNFGSG